MNGQYLFTQRSAQSLVIEVTGTSVVVASMCSPICTWKLTKSELSAGLQPTHELSQQTLRLNPTSAARCSMGTAVLHRLQTVGKSPDSELMTPTGALLVASDRRHCAFGWCTCCFTCEFHLSDLCAHVHTLIHFLIYIFTCMRVSIT